jgi:hypothetical protein
MYLCNYVTFNILIILRFKFIIYYKYTIFWNQFVQYYFKLLLEN